jgi:hypothetical protein
MNPERLKAACLASKYQSLPSRSAQGFSERLVIGWDSADISALPMMSLQVSKLISHFPERDLNQASDGHLSGYATHQALDTIAICS